MLPLQFLAFVVTVVGFVSELKPLERFQSFEGNSLTKLKVTRMAKQTMDQAPPPLWSPDDLPRLAEALERAESQLSSTHVLLIETVERLNKTEATVSLLDPDKAAMPLELTRTLNLAAVYNSAIQGSLMSAFMTNPNLLDQKKYLRKRLNEILDLADELVSVACERHGVKGKLKVDS